MGCKATNAEKLRRESIIQQMLLDGASRKEIIRYAQENWQLSTRAVDWYIKSVNENIEKTLTESGIDSIERHYALDNEILSWCFEQKKINAALRVAKDQAKILGLYHRQRPRRMKVTCNGLNSQQCNQLANGEKIIIGIHLDLATGKLVIDEVNQLPKRKEVVDYSNKTTSEKNLPSPLLLVKTTIHTSHQLL